MNKTMIGAVAVMLVCSPLTGQQQETVPSCNMCPGTYVPRSEIDAYAKRPADGNQIRNVDIGKTHLGVGVVHRGRLTTPETFATAHDLVSELYYVIDGSATLVLGADLVGKTRRPATMKTVRVQDGPGNSATSIRGGVSYDVSKGDIVIIPAGTGHQFTRVDPGITFLTVRIDPDKIVPLKTEADSKTDLAGSGVETPDQARAAGEKSRHLEKAWEPTCRSCPGYYISNGEVQAYLKRALANSLIDQQIRQVDIGKANLAVGIVHRRIQEPGRTTPVIAHDLVSEVNIVIDGSGTLTVGPDLVGKEPRPADITSTQLLSGPGVSAKELRNGASYDLKVGDVAVIPAGSAHQYCRIEDHATYLILRIDPDKVTPHKTEADSKADLLTDGRATSFSGGGNGTAPPPK